MRAIAFVATVGALLLFPGCGGGGEDGKNYRDMAQVVEVLDKHTLSNETRPRITIGDQPGFAARNRVTMPKSEFYGAKDGASFDVDPGGYNVEIFVYSDSRSAVDLTDGLRTTGTQLHYEANAVLLLNTADKGNLDRLVADLRD